MFYMLDLDNESHQNDLKKFGAVFVLSTLFFIRDDEGRKIKVSFDESHSLFWIEQNALTIRASTIGVTVLEDYISLTFYAKDKTYVGDFYIFQH